MTESFGGQTVAFLSVTETGQPGWGGIREDVRVATRCPGVRFRPYSSVETPVTQTDVTTERWKLTAPADAVALAVKGNGELLYDGTEHPELLDLDAESTLQFVFQVDGQKMPKHDMDGPVHHVTIMCKRQVG